MSVASALRVAESVSTLINIELSDYFDADSIALLSLCDIGEATHLGKILYELLADLNHLLLFVVDLWCTLL